MTKPAWDTHRYKNTPQNAHLIERRQEEGYEVYARNRRFVRLRRPADYEESDDTTDDSHSTTQNEH